MDNTKDSSFLEALPEAIVQHILSSVSNARDVSVCSSVCKKWKYSMCHVRRLYFARNVGDERERQSDHIVTRMVLSMTALEELVVYCPFFTGSLLAWLLHSKHSLKVLELRVDDTGEKRTANSSMCKLDCISSSLQLQILRLWGVSLSQPPSGWRCFKNLHTLEIVGARIRDTALSGILLACRFLKELTLLGCDGVDSFCFDLQYLEKCRLDFSGLGDSSIFFVAPMLGFLEIQGAASLLIKGKHSLRHLTIGNISGKVNKVDVGKLPDLESLSVRGVHWRWDAIQNLLECATEVKEIVMKVEFCGDREKLEPFPEIDFVKFFSAHQKLQRFDSQGAMFAALSQRNSLKMLSSTFEIPCLREAHITVRSPFNADQKLLVLESLIRCSPLLCKLAIRISQMKNCEAAADDFFRKMNVLKCTYDVIDVE
ncbi:hypothetical protein O6H91_20G064500 [Diphasiastrum complanatum]|uniref:Uncharacterized protein n=3 Tax=Diphasiastrum complanatum TaxID=34168 RepID=A0ACC2API0_DIPCM|nr:hypothetical protein O6H91_20G041300 [Diphasiastrum complanatum]KAJ7519494.1 hypothetical protein O6H91_20G041300 [Diphasiastrum complanatum]KAJ7520039.1 hypothetical protein O6H91_20G064500 [Diphasiastrum complanatum]